jgi:hypothetical protein
MTSFTTEKPNIQPVHMFSLRLRHYHDPERQVHELEQYINDLQREVNLNRELIKDIIDFMYRLATKDEVIDKVTDMRALIITTLSDIGNHLKENERQLKEIGSGSSIE